MVSKALQAEAKAAAGDLVSVVMDWDRSERIVTIPSELQEVLAKNKKAAQAFAPLSYSHRKDLAEWIATARKEETRRSRAEQSVSMIAAKKHTRSLDSVDRVCQTDTHGVFIQSVVSETRQVREIRRSVARVIFRCPRATIKSAARVTKDFLSRGVWLVADGGLLARRRRQG
jgi:hypothetical protein